MNQSLNNRSYYIDLVKAISIFDAFYVNNWRQTNVFYEKALDSLLEFFLPFKKHNKRTKLLISVAKGEEVKKLILLFFLIEIFNLFLLSYIVLMEEIIQIVLVNSAVNLFVFARSLIFVYRFDKSQIELNDKLRLL